MRCLLRRPFFTPHTPRLVALPLRAQEVRADEMADRLYALGTIVYDLLLVSASTEARTRDRTFGLSLLCCGSAAALLRLCCCS